MRHSIFAKSTLRQPIRTVLLLLITALMVFAFAARATEYLLVKQETERLSGYYRSIGQLSRVDQDHATSAGEAISLLENDPRVAFVDQPRYLSAVMQGIYNGDVSGSKYVAANTKNLDFFFTGIFRGTAETLSGDVLFIFEPEELLSGYPEFIEAGRIVIMIVSRDEGIDTVGVAKEMEMWERYLIRGRFDSSKDMLFPLLQAPEKLCARPLAENAPLFYHIAAGEELDWDDPVLSGLAAEMQRCRDEQSALMAVTTKDMSAMPIVQPNTYLYLTDGRWLDSTDQAAQNKACVINDAFAQLRGLKVGDTIDLTFRNVLTPYGYIDYPENGDIPDYETASDTFEIVGLYDYVMTDMQYWRTAFYRNYAYFVDSAVPAAFDAFEDVRTTADLSFVLTSPAVEAEFFVQTQDQLAALGLRAELLENGWADFQAAARPMLHASLYNLTVFSLILPTALCVVAFFYFRARRREIAIARALGLPAGVCMRQGALPLALIGLVGTACGTVSGWQYTLNRGADTLASLSAFGGGAAEISLPHGWLAAIFGGVFLLVLLLAVGGMAYLSHRPTLELLQGGVQTKQKEEKAQEQAAPDMEQRQKPAGAQVSAAVLAQPLPAAAAAGHTFGAAHTLRFAGCYIRRSKAKSLLAFLLAALFTVGLAAIQVSILNSTAKVDELYQTVNVDLEVVKRNSSTDVKGGFIPRSTIDRIVNTGFISTFYGEAEFGVLNLKREDDFRATGSAPVARPDPTSKVPPTVPYRLYSFSDPDVFLNDSGVDILYHAGWDESMFTPQDWGTYNEACGWQTVLPVLLPQELYEEYRITPGERMVIKINRGVGIDLLMEVAGMYTGRVSDGSTPAILTPAGVIDVITKNAPYYSIARFILDPARNRELGTVRAALDEIINASRAGLVPLRALLLDEDLRNAIEPLEDSIRLMEVLYPVALALSLLAAAGVSALLILTEAREAAIMRVLGTTKWRSRIMLVLQIVFVVLAGLLLGLTASLAWSGSAGPALVIFSMSALRAAAYLICAVAGSTAGAVTVTNRPPLELLQVKE